MTPKSPERIKEGFLSFIKEDSVNLCGIAHFVKCNRDSMIPLMKPRGSALRICGQDGTVYEGNEEQLEAWKDHYLPERMEMEVIGAIDYFPCDAFGLQLVLLLGEDGRVFAYEDELLHLVALNLKDLFQIGMTFPGIETFKLGECFEEPTKEEYREIMESNEVKEMEKLHIEFRQSLENKLQNTMSKITQSRNVHMRKQVDSKDFTSSSKQTIQETSTISKMENGDKPQSPYSGFPRSSRRHSPDVQAIKKKSLRMSVKKKDPMDVNKKIKTKAKKSVSCPRCKKSLTCKSGLKIHMRVHTGKKRLRLL